VKAGDAVRNFGPIPAAIRPGGKATIFAVVLLAAALLAAFGMGLTLGILAGVLGSIAFVLVLNVPLRYLIYAEFVITIFIVGLVDYYLRWPGAYWISYVLALAIFVSYSLSGSESKKRPILFGGPTVLAILIVFICYVSVCTLFSGLPASGIAVGLKEYVPILLVGIVFASISNRTYLEKIELGALTLPFIEAPFVIEQHFSSGRWMNWDSVVGTFGGNPEGGGCSATLMLFLVTSILIAIQRYRSGRLNAWYAASVIVMSLALLLLGEMKSVFIFLPLALLVQNWRALISRPITFVLAALILLGVLQLTYVAYDQLYWKKIEISEDQPYTFDQIMFDFSLNPHAVNTVTGNIGRVAALSIWANDPQTGLARRLFGYGGGASRTASAVSIGPIAKRFYPLVVDTTSASQLLWDVGLIGTVLLIVALLAAILLATKLSKAARLPQDRHRMSTMAALATILIPYIFYVNFLTTMPKEQLLLAIIIGHLAAQARRRDLHSKFRYRRGSSRHYWRRERHLSSPIAALVRPPSHRSHYR
jgi:hypothetical protein